MINWGLLCWLLIWGAVSRPLSAQADSVLDQTPQGLNLDGFFDLGMFDQNAAKIRPVTNALGESQHMIELTNDSNQLGAVWSTPVNRFNLAVDNQLSMWVYFGDDRTAGEGLAVVLQNDPRGNAAISRNGNEIIGENLGVYGTDTYSRRTSSATIANTAIQNSWALELDTKVNNGGFLNLNQRGHSFDQQVRGQHLAVSYPADPATYIQKGGLTSSYRFEQQHLNLRDNLKLSDGGWHQLTLKWSAAQQVMSYTLDQSVTGTTPINPEKFGDGVQDVMWGLTSTATNSRARTLVVVDQLPNPIKVTSNLRVTNLTQQRVVNAGDWVHVDDQLQYDYRLNYLSGNRDWRQIEASLPWSKHVNITGAKVKYADGHEETLPLSTTLGGTHMKYVLPRALSKVNTHVDITLIGKVAKVDRDTAVSDAISYFMGPGTRLSMATPHFMITNKQTVSLAVKPVKVTRLGHSVTVNGQVKLDGGVDFSNDGISVQVTLNGKQQPNYILAKDATAGAVKMTLAASDLHEGTNQLILRARRYDNTFSEPITVPITVIDGTLKFKQLDQQMTFQELTLTGTTQISKPKNWHLVVNDGREVAAAWQLGLTATDFTNEHGGTLAGGLYYRDGDSWQLIDSKQAVRIESRQTEVGADYDVADHWTDQHGLVLKVSGGAMVGTYHSTLSWSLAAVPAA